MTAYLTFIASMLLLVLLLGMVRVIRGPSTSDRMLASQLFGTVGVAILMLLAIIQEQSSLLNIALVMAILAPLTVICFVKIGAR